MNWSHSLNLIIHPDNTVRQKRLCSHWFHRMREILPWAVCVRWYIVHTVGISNGMHTDWGRSRPPRRQSLSGLLETYRVGQRSEGDAIGGNYNVLLPSYQLLTAGFERGNQFKYPKSNTEPPLLLSFYRKVSDIPCAEKISRKQGVWKLYIQIIPKLKKFCTWICRYKDLQKFLTVLTIMYQQLLKHNVHTCPTTL